MIRKVKFNNFYSFKEEQEINFLAQKKNTYDYYTSDTGNQITKIAAFIGGNASGKTNIMRLFSFLRYFVCRSSYDDNSSNPTIAFKTHFRNTRPSSFYIEFESNNNIYYYNVSIKDNIITNEELSLKEISPKSKKIKIFSRKTKTIEDLNVNYFPNFKVEFLEKIRPEISLVAFLYSIYKIDIINNVYDYFSKIKTNINEKGEINNTKYQIKTLKLYLEDKTIKEEMEDIVNNFDIGLKNIDIRKTNKIKDNSSDSSDPQKIEEFILVSGVHYTKEPNTRIAFNYESRGTQSLFFTLANILYSLKHESVVIIDEIELGLHPEALNKLIHYFIDKNKNGKSQLIFSSHSLGFMNQLDMHQIFLVEKNEQCQSFVYRLNQVKNIRSDENFLAKYLSGAYGAYPKIKI
jgi:hypothetical protein